MSQLRFYYDFSCPWSYLALVRLQDVADRNATAIELRPVVVEQVLATENPSLQSSRFAENPAKAGWQKRDLADWARLWGIKFQLPSGWPVDSSLAAAGAVIADRQNAGLAYSFEVFAAYFGFGEDISDAEVLAGIAAEAGMDGADFLHQLESDEPAQQVDEWSDELVRQGGFGTPSIFVDERLFFGNDRIPLVDWMLGPISDIDFVMPGQHG